MTRPLDADSAGPPSRTVHATRLKRRPDFLRAASGRKVHTALFTVQAIARSPGEAADARVGFTVTRKVGNSVERNRIKRRLREAVRTGSDLGIKPSHDYVIVARRAVLDKPFEALASALQSGIGRLDRPSSSGGLRRESRVGSSRVEARP